MNSESLYRNAISRTLLACLCISNVNESLPLPHYYGPESRKIVTSEFYLNPLIIRKDFDEYCLIEPTYDSTRINFAIGQNYDHLATTIKNIYLKMIHVRTEQFDFIGLRRKPALESDISFLITRNIFIQYQMSAAEVISCILDFIYQLRSEMATSSLIINQRGRKIASNFMNEFYSTYYVPSETLHFLHYEYNFPIDIIPILTQYLDERF